jgi:xylose dehydrogenase (NAD/NADP)
MRFGILGTARIARNQFIPGVRASSQAEVYAVASRELDRARTFASELDIPHVFGAYEALLADPRVDAVYIPLPNSLHAEWTIAAARAGKHVLCEKPLAATAAEAERMGTACREAGVILMEGFMWRHHPQHTRVRELLAQGVVGEPNFLRASFTFVLDQPRNIRLNAELQGGSLMDVGCYGVNAARLVFGAEPESVVAQFTSNDGVDRAFAGVLQFAGDRLAMIDSSFVRAPANTYTVEGPRGRLGVERAFRPDTHTGRIHLPDGTVQDVPAANQFALELDHFAASAAAGRLLPPAEGGLAQARVIEALATSARTGRRVQLSPEPTQ